MLKRTLFTALMAVIAAPTFVYAGSVPQDLATRIKATVKATSDGQVQIEQLSKTPLAGIYEAVADGEIFYVDESAKYGFVGGALMDMQKRLDLTAQQMDKRMNIPFDRLPLQHAIKEVHGNGSQVLAVFEDPYCPICRVFTKFLDQLDDVTIYRFMFPVISPQSQELARGAWCSSDKAGIWKAMMAGAKPQLYQGCNIDGLAAILATGERYQINNTPTVVLSSGKRLVGATPPEQFISELSKAPASKEQSR